MYDAVIIGAGVIGTLIARELSKYRLSVCVLERSNDAAVGASRANSGIVHAGFDAKPGTLKALFNLKGSEMMPRLARELGVPYRQNGSLVLGYNDDDKKILERLYSQGHKNGVQKLEIIGREELQRLEPSVSRNAVCALYAPTGGITCPYELTISALGNAMDNGAEFYRNFEVTEIHEDKDSLVIYASDGRTVKTRYAVNAAGVYSDLIARMVGDDSFSIRTRRGEYMLLDKNFGGIVKHTIFKAPTEKGKGVLVSPTVDGNLLLGPTAEEQQDRGNTETTSKGLSDIIKQINEEVEGVPIGAVITSFAGTRAASDAGDFIIRPYGKRMVHAAGIESPGLSAAPAIAPHVAKLLRDLGLSAEKRTDFMPERRSYYWFRDLNTDEKNSYIHDHPEFGKIVCRCETVSEGEILEAIRREPKALDLDGVKRRTRSGMGRCQGGFCTPRIVELLAQEQNIPIERVTKSGNGTYLNVCKTKGGGIV